MQGRCNVYDEDLRIMLAVESKCQGRDVDNIRI